MKTTLTNRFEPPVRETLNACRKSSLRWRPFAATDRAPNTDVFEGQLAMRDGHINTRPGLADTATITSVLGAFTRSPLSHFFSPPIFIKEPPMSRSIVDSSEAPAAIGPYSQAVRADNTVYFSGQIPLDPVNGSLVVGDIAVQTRRVFDNLVAVASSSGGSLVQVVRICIYLTDLSNFSIVNAVMAEYFQDPYPARSTIEVSGLPKGAQVEVDAVMVLD
jgi:reactive intermediate/imine deaminase